ncbi:Uu.00g010140.m01.CDS01 [Anthostomella pinea]|uniref:Uu.00g010140.m01.CDS01 n=1 Tax=Anthostomella pinea TaxID=933095 RepID=A0AAI8VY50_9PEZI|nr:Uu.00g010140.m01.CDS01 [Anthostomella pinea]
MEPSGIRKLMAKGFDIASGNMQGPRAAVLVASLSNTQDETTRRGDTVQNGELSNAPLWMKAVPTNVMKALAPESDAPTITDAILRITRKRFSSLILMPLEQVDVNKPLAQFGVDSMIAADVRTWLWNSFRVDIPFLDILNSQKTLSGLAELLGMRLSGT